MAGSFSSSIEKPEFPSNLNILAIDTDLKVLEFIEKSCNENSHQVKICSESSSAVDLLLKKEIDFHLIFMELHMPMMDGYEFLRFLDKEVIDVAFVMMSEDDTDLSHKKAFKLGACDYWVKPFLEYAFLFERRHLCSPMMQHHFHFRRIRKNIDSLEDDEISETSYSSEFSSEEEAEADDDTLHKKE
ncbi:two-component response regulator ARR14-like [Vigna umbellata]|uniref:two-component response regulator ARR14-like n=1 Tax=Vigna umbellata TaxID=87088 RepID=UPI001F5E8B55|nr:two-component response regulator ARR14-like [Vigna umbellata]XP_047158057.1 two-component response regulator ARR14-like [Vigna umbellata]